MPADAVRSRRILVVEDEWLIAAELETMLEAFGCAVIGPANQVAQALRLIADDRPDAALLDISLGRERSYPVAETLRQLGVPFLFLTGYMAVDLPPAFAGSRMLSKPVLSDALRDALATL